MPTGATQFQYQGRALPVYFAPETVTADRWLPTLTQPLRKAFAVALLTSGAVSPTFVPQFPFAGLAPTFAQPERRARYAASFRAEVLTTSPEAVTADRTPAVWVQPSRAVRYAAGTSNVAPVLPQPLLTFRRALVAQLLADPGVSGLVGSKVHPLKVPETVTLPALTYQVTGTERGQHLDSPSGVNVATVQFAAVSKNLSACEAIAEAVRQLFDGFQGYWPGKLEITDTASVDEQDLYEDAVDGSDRGTYRTVLIYHFHYREAKPSRFG